MEFIVGVYFRGLWGTDRLHNKLPQRGNMLYDFLLLAPSVDSLQRLVCHNPCARTGYTCDPIGFVCFRCECMSFSCEIQGVFRKWWAWIDDNIVVSERTSEVLWGKISHQYQLSAAFSVYWRIQMKKLGGSIFSRHVFAAINGLSLPPYCSLSIVLRSITVVPSPSIGWLHAFPTLGDALDQNSGAAMCCAVKVSAFKRSGSGLYACRMQRFFSVCVYNIRNVIRRLLQIQRQIQYPLRVPPASFLLIDPLHHRTVRLGVTYGSCKHGISQLLSIGGLLPVQVLPAADGHVMASLGFARPQRIASDSVTCSAWYWSPLTDRYETMRHSLCTASRSWVGCTLRGCGVHTMDGRYRPVNTT